MQAAWTLERQHLRALPVQRPATCRVVARVADKFGHVRVDHETYSVPIRHAYRPVWVTLYHDRVAVAVGAEVVAQHPRAFRRGAKVLDARHVLPLLERKHRAVPEATALRGWRLAPVWQQVRAALATHTRKPDQAGLQVVHLRVEQLVLHEQLADLGVQPLVLLIPGIRRAALQPRLTRG